LGADLLAGGWRQEGRAKLGAFPIGVVGHWPAGNIEIQPVLSMSCALLGGNSCIVRVPSGLLEATRKLIEKLKGADRDGALAERVALVAFDHSRDELHEAMAQAVDGAMIWGGAEAVSKVRALPFPHWARVAVFGPRLSVAAMDAQTWSSPTGRATWCRRIARDVWQFDQQACTSPQVLFIERGAEAAVSGFVGDLRRAFEEENRVHPRETIHPALTSSICLARASWLLDNVGQKAFFPDSPDWTILLGAGSDIPTPTQGRTLHVLEVRDLMDAISKFGGAVQTLGLAISDPGREKVLAQAAAREGVDRIVKLGRMHVFGSPWDGVDLIRPMVRLVRHVSSLDEAGI
jgi:Acyl-CoA reductase (LuxC)